jgi:excisionase family DNA binding protein
VTSPAAERIALRPSEAAEALGVSERVLMTWVKDGEIPHTRLGERCLRFPVDGLKRWVSARTTWPTALAQQPQAADQDAEG